MNSNTKREQQAEDPEGTFRIESGELLVWRPSRAMTSRIPVVTIGAFRNGVPCINFRLHRLKDAGVLAPMHDGIALSFDELATVNERLAKIAEALSDAA